MVLYYCISGILNCILRIGVLDIGDNNTVTF
jgi:hypothetical protein